MSDESQYDGRFDSLADEFVSRYRNGERPALAEYCERYPDLADDIRRLFPALAAMERARPDEDKDSSATSGRGLTGVLNFERLGDYRILREVARGGMGIVYEAEQESLGRHVALKILPPQAVLDPRHLQRFQREARAAARLHHTNIVPVFGVGESNGVHYYVMQFIQGRGLDQVLVELRRLRFGAADTASDSSTAITTGLENPNASFRVRSPSNDGAGPQADTLAWETTSLSQNSSQYWQSVARIGVQVADAIDYAYAQGVLHRDIKPSNLLLDSLGTVWVTDFGLAKSSDSDDLTHTGDIVGTLKYLAPERLRGEVSIRSDIYSLGVTLFEMLTLRPPFQHIDRSHLVRCIAEEEPIHPRRLDRNIPSDFEKIVLKAMAKHPDDRYQSAADLAVDLRRFLEDRPVAARQIGTIERLWRWCRRNPRLATLTASVATLLVAVAVISALAAHWLRQERDAARNAEDAAFAAVKKQNSAEVAQRQELFRAYLQDAQSTLRTGQMGQRFGGLDSIKRILETIPANELSDEQKGALRDEAIAHLALADCEEISRFASFAIHHDSVPFDPALEHFADNDERGASTIIRRIDDPVFRHELQIDGPDHRQYPTSRRFSPSGRWLLEIRHKAENHANAQLVVWDWRAQRIVYRDAQVSRGRFCFHPNDHYVLYERITGVPVVVDILTGKTVTESPRNFFRGAGVAFNPDGRLLAICSPEMTTEVVTIDDWKTVATIPRHANWMSVAWHPREGYAVFGGTNGRLFGWNPMESVGWLLPSIPPAHILNLGFSKDGNLLAIGGGDNVSEIRNTGVEGQRITVPGQFQLFGSNSNRFAVRRNERTLTINEAKFSTCLAKIPCQAESTEFSPDGHWLAASGPNGVQVFSTNPWREVANLGLDPCGPVAFHPSGTSLSTFGMFSHAQNWPISSRIDSNDRWRIGPPTSLLESNDIDNLRKGRGLAPHHFGRHVAYSANGKLVAVVHGRFHQIWLGAADSSSPLQLFTPFASARRVAISPTGEWLAACANVVIRHTGVFRVSDKQKVLDIPGHGAAAFSADGEYFASCSVTECQVFRTGTWTLQHTIPIREMPNWDAAPVAFQPQGELIAIADSFHRTRLYDRRTGRNVANLTHSTSETAHTYWLSFSSDGRYLALTQLGKYVYVWDLDLLRTELIALGVDTFELPPSAAFTENAASQRITFMDVERGPTFPRSDKWYQFWRALAFGELFDGQLPDAIANIDVALTQPTVPTGRERAELLGFRGDLHLRNKNAASARNDWREAVALAPDMYDIQRKLARLELLGPSEMRDPAEALARIAPLAGRVTSNPEDRILCGIALYLTGLVRESVAMLEEEDSDNNDTPIRLLFLTVGKTKISQVEQAEFYNQRLLDWLKSHPDQEIELQPILSEFRPAR